RAPDRGCPARTELRTLSPESVSSAPCAEVAAYAECVDPRVWLSPRLTFRTIPRRLFHIKRTAAWRSATPLLKMNIIFRNERPSIMNISLTTGGSGHGQRRRHETVRSWVARQRVPDGDGDHGQPRLRSPSRIGTRWITISSSKPALRHCAARLAPKMITALPAAAAFAVATPSLTEPEMNVTAGWGFALGGRCVSTNTGPFHVLRRCRRSRRSCERQRRTSGGRQGSLRQCEEHRQRKRCAARRCLVCSRRRRSTGRPPSPWNRWAPQ